MHHCGRPGGAAAQLGQDFPGLEGGDGAFAAAADPAVGLVHGLLPARPLRPVAVPLKRGTHGTAGAFIRLVREGHHVSVGQRGDDAVGPQQSGRVPSREVPPTPRRGVRMHPRDYLHVHPVPSVLSGAAQVAASVLVRQPGIVTLTDDDR